MSFVMPGTMARALLLCIIQYSLCSVSTGGGLERNPADSSPEQKVISSSNRAILPLGHRRGPDFPAQKTKHEPPSLAETLRRDEARRNHIIAGRSARHMAVQPPTNGVVIPAELGYSVDSLEYVVTVGLGTPPVAQTVVIDSGSDFAWVQCMPCDSGKKDPPFDPRRSSTYAPIPCDSDACRNISDYMGNGCKVDDDPCGFALSYADGSNSTGVYSRDKLTLAPGVAVEGFRFGCSHDQERWTDMSDGLVGLGSSPESLVSQASPSHGGAFSYCLPPTASSTGFLALGRPSNTSGFVFTPMLPSDHVAVFYRVTLTGISVAGRPLDVPPAAFPHGGYGMILDSGTVVTWLPAVPYAAMREAFRRAMAAYPLAPPIHPVDTCYNLTGYSNVTVPSVALAFMGGATVELDNPSGILVEGCLAFAGLRPDDHGNGVIGNVNQRTFEVLYDLMRLRVGFRAGAC